jgi:hypothetical protein
MNTGLLNFSILMAREDGVRWHSDLVPVQLLPYGRNIARAIVKHERADGAPCSLIATNPIYEKMLGLPS